KGLRRQPEQEYQAEPRLPDDNRPQFRRSAAGNRFSPIDGKASSSNASQLEARARRDHRGLRIGRRGEEALPARVEGTETVPSHRAAAAIIAEHVCKTSSVVNSRSFARQNILQGPD